MMRPSILILCLLSSASAELVTVADPFVKMPEGKSVVWSPLFQATWDAMNAKMGGKPQRIEPPNGLMSRLDAFKWEPGNVLPEGSSPEFLDLVNREAAKTTGEEKGPFTLKDPIPGTIACFGLLDREVEFAKPFHRSGKVPMLFGGGKSPVRFFGTKDDASGQYGMDVKVLAYRPVDGSHALEVSCKGGDDKVVFYRPPEGQDFATACTWLRVWRKTFEFNAELPDGWNDRSLHEGDEVRVPYVSLDVTDELAGQLQGGRFYGIAGDPWVIRRAEQRMKFELHEKGARVRVEASLSLDPFGPEPPRPYPRRFVYDRPFFVFLWRDKAEWPYLGVWVGDASALRKF
jgi:hypothetical protein